MANTITTNPKDSRASIIDEREHELALQARRITEIPTNLQLRIEYNVDGTQLYIGYGARGLASSANGWLIHKFTYNANKQPTLRQSAYDTWDNRATANYQ